MPWSLATSSPQGSGVMLQPPGAYGHPMYPVPGERCVSGTGSGHVVDGPEPTAVSTSWCVELLHLDAQVNMMEVAALVVLLEVVFQYIFKAIESIPGIELTLPGPA